MNRKSRVQGLVKTCYFVASLLIVVGAIFISAGNPMASGGLHGECESVDIQGYQGGTINERSFTDPNSEVIMGVCIKSAPHMFRDGHSQRLVNGDYQHGCYTVTGVGTSSVTVTRNPVNRHCGPIEHIDICIHGHEH